MSPLAGNLIRPNGSRKCCLPPLVPTWNSTQVLSELRFAPFPNVSWSWQEPFGCVKSLTFWADFWVLLSWMIAGSACAWSPAIGQPRWNCLNPRVAVQSLIPVTISRNPIPGLAALGCVELSNRFRENAARTNYMEQLQFDITSKQTALMQGNAPCIFFSMINASNYWFVMEGVCILSLPPSACPSQGETLTECHNTKTT